MPGAFVDNKAAMRGYSQLINTNCSEAMRRKEVMDETLESRTFEKMTGRVKKMDQE